jgi:hypothetical protein
MSRALSVQEFPVSILKSMNVAKLLVMASFLFGAHNMLYFFVHIRALAFVLFVLPMVLLLAISGALAFILYDRHMSRIRRREPRDFSREPGLLKNVENWVHAHESMFGTSEEPLYDGRIFGVLTVYDDATIAHLETQLKIIQDVVKWAHQVYQAIVFTGVIGTVLVLINFLLDAFKSGPLDNLRLVGLVIVLILISLLVLSLLKRDKATRAPWLPNIILKRSGIKQSLNNRLIEAYYINKLLELRNEKVRFCKRCGEELPYCAVYCSSCGNSVSS